MTTWQPPHRIALPAAQQEWQAVTFLHWRYDPAVIDRLLPEEVAVDTFDGSAWVGLTPFRMEAGMLPLVARPSVSAGEVNVRTYVRVGDDDGLWFLSLEIDKSLVAKSLRTVLQLPYRKSEVTVAIGEGHVDYGLRRDDGADEVRLDLGMDIGERVPDDDVTDLEVFLMARWRAFTQAYGRVLAVPVEHRAWPVRRAAVTRLDENLLAAVDLPAPDGEPHVGFSDGVHARLGAPRPVAR